MAFIVVGLAGLGAATQEDGFYVLPSGDGSWTAPSENVGRLPSEPIRVEIEGIGFFAVDPGRVRQRRPDVFSPGHLSVFDLITHLGETDQIELISRYDESMRTHVIDSIDGETGWWYEAQYDSGWFERNTTRMDLYPVKGGTVVRVRREQASRIERIHESFTREVERLEANGGDVIIPSVEIEGPRGRLAFENVLVTSHGVRTDLWKSGTVTALDILLSLGEQGRLTRVGLHWYPKISGADPVDGHFIELVEADGFLAEASGGCGFVYEVGDTDFFGFDGAHVHIPTDARAILSPEYALWFWLCL